MLYKLTNVITPIPDDYKASETDVLVSVKNVVDWQQWMNACELNPTPTTAYENSLVCKLESYQDGFFSTFSIPIKHDYETHDHFAGYITKNALHFIDDDNTVVEIINSICVRSEAQMTIGQFFAYFIEQLISEELPYLAELEARVSELEEKMLDNKADVFNTQMMEVRKELADYHRYYSQMSDVGQNLQTYGESIFNQQALTLFHQFTERVLRLLNEVNMLREYSMQVREVYQTTIDVRQNEVMRVLTVVTTIFLPLTLVVGWYGMNFRFMPELGWKLGYPLVGVICAAIVVVCLWIFKKKKFW